jgi:hypothetical protein
MGGIGVNLMVLRGKYRDRNFEAVSKVLCDPL